MITKYPFLQVDKLKAFQAAISEMNSDSFMIPLTRSMGLVLEEFYNTLLPFFPFIP